MHYMSMQQFDEKSSEEIKKKIDELIERGRSKKNVPVAQLSLFLCVGKNVVKAKHPCASCRGREDRGLELQHLVSPSIIEAT